jgi:hypothetical protein
MPPNTASAVSIVQRDGDGVVELMGSTMKVEDMVEH